MNIGELAERTGLSRSRIRFYESKGLLSLVSRSGNGYRHYPPDAVLILTIITCAQQAGFSLSEIAKVLPADLAHWKHDELVGLLKHKVADINNMIGQLELSLRNLDILIKNIENKPTEISCNENTRGILATINRQCDPLNKLDDN